MVTSELGTSFVNALTGERLQARSGMLAVGDVLAQFPVALLLPDGDGRDRP